MQSTGTSRQKYGKGHSSKGQGTSGSGGIGLGLGQGQTQGSVIITIPEITGLDIARVYKLNHSQIPDSEKGKCKTFGITVPLSEFDEPRRRFCNLKSSSVYAPIVELLFMMFDPVVMGGKNVPNQPYHKSPTEYKYELAVETVVREGIKTLEEASDKDIVAYRIFAHIFDNTISPQQIVDSIVSSTRVENTIHLRNVHSRWDLETKVYGPLLDYLKEAVQTNIVRIGASANTGANASAQGIISVEETRDDPDNDFGDNDEIEGEENLVSPNVLAMDVSMPTAMNNIDEILNYVALFNHVAVSGAKAIQKDGSKYFNYNVSQDAFNGKYPCPDLVCKIAPDEASRFFRHPLPNNLIAVYQKTETNLRYAKFMAIEMSASIDLSIDADETYRLRKDLSDQNLLIKQLEDFNISLLSGINAGAKNADEILNTSMTRMFAESVDLIRLQLKWEPIMAHFMQTRSPPRGVNNGWPRETQDKFVKDLEKLRKDGLKDVECMMRESEKVSAVVRESRKFFDLDASRQFSQNVCMFEHLTPFGNMIANLNYIWDTVFKVHVNNALVMLNFTALLSAFRFAFDKLKVNVVASGKQGGGKSFAWQVIRDIALPGAVTLISSKTARADNTQTHRYQEAEIYDELVLNEWGGTGPRGNKIPPDPQLKSKITSGYVSTYAYKVNTDSPARTSTLVASVHQCSIIASTNYPPEDPAMRARIINYPMAPLSRPEGQFYKAADDSPVNTFERDQVIKSLQLHQFYVLALECCIAAKVLPDVPSEHFDEFISRMSTEFKARGMNEFTPRSKEKLFAAVRAWTLFYAVRMAFFSEFGINVRKDTNGFPRKFQMTDLLECLKFMEPTEELMAYCIGLMECEFVDSHTTEIVRAMSRLAKWPSPILEARAAPFYTDETRNNDAVVDYDYISIVAENRELLLQQIITNMSPPPSGEDVKTAINILCTKMYNVPMHDWKISEKNSKRQSLCCCCDLQAPVTTTPTLGIEKCSFCQGTKHGSHLCNSTLCRFRPPAPAPAAASASTSTSDAGPDANTNTGPPHVHVQTMACVVCRQDTQELCGQCYSRCHRKCAKKCASRDCHILSCPHCLRNCLECNLRFHTSCIETHEDYVEVRTGERGESTLRLLPAIKVDYPLIRGRKFTRYSFLTMLPRMMSDNFMDAIKTVVETEHLERTDFITALPHVDHSEAIPVYMRGSVYPQYARVVTLNPNLKKRSVIMQSVKTPAEWAMSQTLSFFVLDPKSKEEAESSGPETVAGTGAGANMDQNQEPALQLTEDMGLFYLRRFLRAEGVVDELELGYPPNAKKFAWELRKRHPLYRICPAPYSDQTYPDFHVKCTKDTCKKRYDTVNGPAKNSDDEIRDEIPMEQVKRSKMEQEDPNPMPKAPSGLVIPLSTEMNMLD